METHVSYNLNSLKGVIKGVIIGVIKGDTRSLDDGSCRPFPFLVDSMQVWGA